MKRIVCLFLLVCLFVAPVNATAESTSQNVMPLWTNVISVDNVFYIGNTGTTTVKLDYIASSNTFQSIRIETKIQKNILFFFWIDIDGGSWTDSFTTQTGSFKHTIQLADKATYRAVFHVYAVGNDGSVDDFELTKEYVYE